MKKKSFLKENEKLVKTLLCLTGAYFLVVVLNIPIPLRYSMIPGPGLINRRFDRLTGRVEIVRSIDREYEKHLANPAPTLSPTPIPKPFPKGHLGIVDMEMQTSVNSWAITGTLTNIHDTISAGDINAEIKFIDRNTKIVFYKVDKVIRNPSLSDFFVKPNSESWFRIDFPTKELPQNRSYNYQLSIKSAKGYYLK